MGTRRLHRKLTKVSDRLRALRSELHIIDEQLAHLADDAGDQEIRALVSETAAASFEARDARRHADAMASHRAHIVAEIDDLERKQDELLDQLNGAA